jgi:uncharacterized protein YjiS (DUF1127 family)
MTIPSETVPLTHVTPLSLAQRFIHRISAAVAGRRERRQKKAASQMLKEMDVRLLDDIGVDNAKQDIKMDSLSRLNPTVLAFSVFNAPHNGR